MAYIVKQIAELVNDAVNEALAKKGISPIETTDFVSMGKALEEYDLYEGFYGALANRIVATEYFVRSYEANKRNILRDERMYSAFIQKVYLELANAVDNPAWDIPNSSTGAYQQHSPYDVEGTLMVSALTYGGQGTWSIELIRPIKQMKTAFLNESEAIAFVSAFMTQVENTIQLQLEAVEAAAANTAMASAISGGISRNVLDEFNDLNAGSDPITDEDVALRNPDYLRYVAKEINDTIDALGKMSTAFNKVGYATFTPKEYLVLEMLTKFSSALDVYLKADTFHDNLLALPNFDKVPFWQTHGGVRSDFATASTIDVTHDDFITDLNETGEIKRSGIIAFIHDVENVAAKFGDRDTWEELNKRDKVVIHGESAEKGYVVDNHANSIVFYMAVSGTATISATEAQVTTSLSTTHVNVGSPIVLTAVAKDGYKIDSVTVGAVEIDGIDGKYVIIPADNEDMTITVTTSSAS